ncbi:MAG TPA: 6-phosphogluconolactonase [Verrucomicrobiae bacterium]|nr:6-phosphogluconolactonase [Verrucomicrobiae bacterium]
MKKFELISFATADELARAVAGAWLDEIESANRTGKLHGVALSGGRIAQKFFTSVVNQARARKLGDGGTPSLPSNVHFFWADERCVPPGDPESNFRMVNELLFAPLKIPENQIHRLRGEDLPAMAVKEAEAELRQIVPSNPDGQPVLDLVLLGMGEDGHVASLFPGAPVGIIPGAAPFLAVENSPKPPPRRLSLSYAAIAAAGQVWVLISGAGKERAFRESLDFPGKTPLGRVIELRQKTLIFSQIGADEKN